MTYVKTKLQHSIDIDAIITLHYFEYMKNFEFKGESHNFWEFLYVDKGTVAVRADDTWTTLYTGDIIFHQPNEFHAIKSIGKDSPNLVAMSFTSSSQAMSFFVNKSFTLSMEERAMISRIITEGRHTLATPMHIPSVEQVQLKEHGEFIADIFYRQLFADMIFEVFKNFAEAFLLCRFFLGRRLMLYRGAALFLMFTDQGDQKHLKIKENHLLGAKRCMFL